MQVNAGALVFTLFLVKKKCYYSSMIIDDELITRLEDLSYLRLSSDEKNRITGVLQEILSCIEMLEELNTGDLPECSHPLNNVNIFRDDQAHPSFERELILRNAAQRNNEMFIAPKTVD